MQFSRRAFLAATGAVAAPLLLPGCGFTGGGSGGSGDTDTLTFTTWGTDAELASFRSAIAAFQEANEGMTVELNAVPYEQMFTNIDAQLQAGNPPDIFRVPYYTFGAYAGQGQLLDLSPHLSDGVQDQFTETAWAAVQNGDSPFGLPHHTDTSAILYNADLLAAAGITDIPTRVEDAWTWDELSAVAEQLKANLPGGTYPFAYNWQGNGVTRWLSLLFQADGAFLDTDQQTPLIDSDAGRAAVEFSSSFFRNGWVPDTDTTTSSTYAADSWFSGTVAMVWSGAFQIPDAVDTADFEWGVTFAPRRVRGGGDFGGNALVATADTARPELAAAFLEFVTAREQMQAFCQSASLLPTRPDLLDGSLAFDVRPELTDVFVGQASQVQPQDAAQVASPSMAGIIPVLKQELDAAFLGSQDAAATVTAMAQGIADATGA